MLLSVHDEAALGCDGAVHRATDAAVTRLWRRNELLLQEAIFFKESVVSEEIGVEVARGDVEAGLLAFLLRLYVGEQILNILIQVSHNIGAAGSEAGHVLG